MRYILTLCFSSFFAIIILLFIFTPPKCEHENMKTVFSFQPQNSTANSYYKPYCENCNNDLGYTMFRNTPSDTSYLDAVKSYIDGDEIVGGEDYTMTAVVSLGDYDSQKTRIRCKVEKDDIIVGFSVQFRDELEEEISLIKEGDEITFRGKLYEEGFGWTDCELVR